MSLCRARTGNIQSLYELLPKNHISEKIISDNFNFRNDTKIQIFSIKKHVNLKR